MATILSTWKRPGEVAIRAGQRSLDTGGSLLDAMVAGLAAAEDDPDMIAIGRGSLPNSDGEIELDASIMDGRDLSCGAVCAVRGILPVIQVARWVMERTEHVMLAGDQARRFAMEQGLGPQNLVTATVAERYEKFLESPEASKRYVHSVEDGGPDTVTMLGWEGESHCVAASSTSGMPFKMPGRVGDSPIIGAGIYADDEAGSAGATGWGEELWKTAASVRVVDQMRAGRTPNEACQFVIDQMVKRRPVAHDKPCVVLAINNEGEWGAACVGGEFDLWVSVEGAIECHHFVPRS